MTWYWWTLIALFVGAGLYDLWIIHAHGNDGVPPSILMKALAILGLPFCLFVIVPLAVVCGAFRLLWWEMFQRKPKDVPREGTEPYFPYRQVR